jgi:hypothetical protein
MIKDVRQFQMTFDGGRGLCLISPVQGNEEGRKRAEDDQGVWKGSGVNNDKELSRSMDFIMGVFNKGQLGGCNDLVFSFPKDRDASNNTPFFAHMTGAGWIMPGGAENATHTPDPNSDAVMNAVGYPDTIGESIDIEVPE